MTVLFLSMFSIAPTCADFTITEAQVLASLVGFTTQNGGTIATPNINYYGSWWNTNVGTGVDVASDFCTAGLEVPVWDFTELRWGDIHGWHQRIHLGELLYTKP